MHFDKKWNPDLDYRHFVSERSPLRRFYKLTIDIVQALYEPPSGNKYKASKIKINLQKLSLSHLILLKFKKNEVTANTLDC